MPRNSIGFGALALAGLALAALSPALPAHAQGAALQSASAPEPGDKAETQSIPAAAPGQAPEGSVGGMGDINLYPKRVVMTDRDRTASIGLYNRAAATGDYEITLTDMMMTPEGQLINLASVTDPAQIAKVHTASSLLRWSPRRVTLPANEAQMVRIMSHVPPGLPPGEYRAHFTVVSVPQDAGDMSIEQAVGAGDKGLGVRIVPRFGISIPVILRLGETTLNVGLEGLAVTGAPGAAPAFRLQIKRSGTRSAFGDLVIAAPGVKTPVGILRGVGVYTEIDGRTVQIPIDPKADPRTYAKGARLTVTYTDDDFAPGKVLARQDFIVP